MIEPSKIFGRLGNSLFQYATLYAKARDEGTNFYFQNPKYFEKYEKEIKELFSDGISKEPLPYVSIHVRRGDYVENPFYVDLTKTDYYQKAMAMFPDSKFLVFSDEIDWCRSYFRGNDDVHFYHDSELNDFNRMVECKNNIIANSSFSWWAAFLNPNPNKKVIAPSYDRWYSDGSKTRTIIYKDWIQI